FPFRRFEQRAVVGADQPQIVGAPALHEAQIARVIDDAGKIRVFEIDAHRHYVAARADLAIESGARHSIDRARAKGSTWSRVSGASGRSGSARGSTQVISSISACGFTAPSTSTAETAARTRKPGSFAPPASHPPR